MVKWQILSAKAEQTNLSDLCDKFVEFFYTNCNEMFGYVKKYVVIPCELVTQSALHELNHANESHIQKEL